MTAVDDRPHVHLITPGDHFSPGTGSAIPTVVHGLAGAAPPDAAPDAVLVRSDTYPDRYETAEVVEYRGRDRRAGDRVIDVLAGRCGWSRPGEQRILGAALAPLADREDSIVFVHNAPQAVPLVPARHSPVLYAHNQLFRTYGQRETRRVLTRVERVLCVSKFLAEDVAHRIPPELVGRLRVVHNAVDADFFAGPRVVRSGPLRVTFLGRIVPEKGVHVLLKALRAIGRRDMTLTVAGRPGFSATAPLSPYERQLRHLAATLDPQPLFTSFLSRGRVSELLRATDVLVVPSIWPEPFGLTALEGMAAGAAVVASDIGGLPEAGGTAAVLVPPGNTASLADVLRTLADDPSELARLQAESRRHATVCSWSRARLEIADALRR